MPHQITLFVRFRDRTFYAANPKPRQVPRLWQWGPAVERRRVSRSAWWWDGVTFSTRRVGTRGRCHLGCCETAGGTTVTRCFCFCYKEHLNAKFLVSVKTCHRSCFSNYIICFNCLWLSNNSGDPCNGVPSRRIEQHETKRWAGRLVLDYSYSYSYVDEPRQQACTKYWRKVSPSIELVDLCPFLFCLYIRRIKWHREQKCSKRISTNGKARNGLRLRFYFWWHRLTRNE